MTYCYLPRTLVNRDLILGEDTLSRFDDSYLLEAYMETTEGFAGEARNYIKVWFRN
jgi:hypothetical protein